MHNRPTDAGLDQAHELHQRITMAQDACSDAVDMLLDAKSLPALTSRSLRRVLAQAMRHLADAERLTSGGNVAAAFTIPAALDTTEAPTLEVR